MSIIQLNGLGVAMITPFNQQLQIDFKQLETLTEHIISEGADYLVVCGTTGETPAMSKQEKQEVLDCIKKVNNKRLPIVFGAGGNNTYGAVEEINSYNLDGVDAILSVVPYYNKPTQEGMYQHFKYIAERISLPIVLYNIPGRTAANMSAETTLRLANEFENIIAIKEASGDMAQMEEILAKKPSGFSLISGDDAITLELIKKGGIGIISVIGNVLTSEFKQVVSNSLKGDFESAAAANAKLIELYGLLFRDGNPAGIKVLAEAKGICDNYVRLPLVKARPETKDLLLEALSKVN